MPPAQGGRPLHRVAGSARLAIVPSTELVLPEQLWIDVSGSGQTPAETAEVPVFDDENGLPAGGLWTSSYSDGSSEYVRRMLLVLDGFMALAPRRAWLLTPEPATVFEVDDTGAESELRAIAPGAPFWPQLAGRFDAVHMTAKGALAFPSTPAPGDIPPEGGAAKLAKMHAARGPLDFWEAERTIWFRWLFSSARRIEDVAFPLLSPHIVA